ncbi:MAG: hypothetical protein V1824_04565, partial [archaeon]
GKNPTKTMNEFLEKYNFKEFNFDGSSIIPISANLKTRVYNNMLLVGDAGCFIKATTGGGIVFGLLSAKAASVAITERLKKFKPLSNYDKSLSRINLELGIHYKIHKYINSLNNLDLEELMQELKSAEIEEFLSRNGDMDFPTSFISKALLKPKLLRLTPKAIDILRN